MTRTAAALAALGLTLSACGSTTIDSGKVEQLIRDNLAGAKPDKIACPDDVEADKGSTFECKLEYPGRAPAIVTIHIEDEDGRVSFGPADLRPGR
jgi:hypothetical protein